MKLIIERRRPLNEKLMLKPGPQGWDLYAQLVASAYMSAPASDPKAALSFKELIPFIEKMFKRIQSRVNIEFVDYHPYKTAAELRQDASSNGIMKVATIDADHRMFNVMTNAKFRAIHDYMSHVQAIGSRGTDFTLRGELAAYNTHLKTVPRGAIPALFTEVVGQVCVYIVAGQFAEQKIALLPGFNYYKIGVVDGYDIVNKELVKK